MTWKHRITRNRRFVGSTAIWILGIALLSTLALIIGAESWPALAFDEDGFRSGMSVNEALAVFDSSFGGSTEMTAPGSDKPAFMAFRGPARSVQFCHDRLISYEKELSGDSDTFVKAVAIVEQKMGKPIHRQQKGDVGGTPVVREIYSWRTSADDETIQLVLIEFENQKPQIHAMRINKNNCGISGY